jgi:hypothetical protein
MRLVVAVFLIIATAAPGLAAEATITDADINHTPEVMSKDGLVGDRIGASIEGRYSHFLERLLPPARPKRA